MKHFFAILFIGVLLFNWIGYRLVFLHMANEASSSFETALNNNDYDETQLISIKIPITHVAYYNPSNIFERADGQIQYAGITYKFVKRRLYNDSLELLCIPDHPAMQLNSARNEFFKLVNDLQPNNQSKKADSHKSFSKTFSTDNYVVGNFPILSHAEMADSKQYSQYSAILVSTCGRMDERPPRLFS